jgi:hypothetical protein
VEACVVLVVSMNSSSRASYIEAGIVLVVLGGVLLLTGRHLTDLLSALAGFLTFLCTQIAFDMNEQLQLASSSSRPHRHSYRYLFMMKELVWIITFIILGSAPLLASTGVFATYPYWRKTLRAK